MARTADGPRKTEFVGIPLDREMKRRLVRVSRTKKRAHTDVAREYIADGIAKDEQVEQPAPIEEPAAAK